MSVSVRACAASRAAEGGVGVGFAKPWVKTRGLGSGGPSGEARPFTSARKMAAVAAMVLAALFVGR